MRDVNAELKDPRLHGMVSAWTDLMAQAESAVASSKWLIEHLLRAEPDRAECNFRRDRQRPRPTKIAIQPFAAGVDQLQCPISVPPRQNLIRARY
jgi:hypothetical protein